MSGTRGGATTAETEPAGPVINQFLPATEVDAAGAGGTAGTAGTGVGSRRPDAPRWITVALIVGFVVNVAWRLWIARALFTPIVFGDESRYLMFARVLSGGPGGYGGDTEATRRAGYALLISPAYWVTSDPFLVHRLVQGLNALVSAAIFPLAYVFARRVLDTDRRWGLGLAAVAATLPAVTFFAPFALPNAVLPTLLVAWLLTLHGWMTGARFRSVAAAGSGAIVAAMYVIHVRALLLLAVHAVVVLGLLVARRTGLFPAVASGAAAAAFMVVHPVLKHLLHGKVVTGGIEPESRMTAAFTTVDGILRTFSDATGQIWYLCAGTWGLGALGLAWMLLRLWQVRYFPWPSTVVLAACLASTAMVAVVTAAALPDDGKANNHIFPGYIMFLAPVWVMVGLAALRTAPWRRIAGVTAAALGLMLGSWFLVESYSRPDGPIGKPRLFSPIDAPEVLFLVGDWDMVHLARVTVITLGLITLAGAALLVKRSAYVAALLLVAVVAVNGFALRASTEEMVRIAVSHRGPELVGDAGVRPGEVVACDTRLMVRFNHQREVYWRPLVTVDLSHDAPPSDVDVLIAPWHTGDPARDWDGTAHGWRMVTSDRELTWAMWRPAGR